MLVQTMRVFCWDDHIYEKMILICFEAYSTNRLYYEAENWYVDHWTSSLLIEQSLEVEELLNKQLNCDQISLQEAQLE